MFFFLSVSCVGILFFFFFQAEDGIRDGTVTGVQTCALPIYGSVRRAGQVSQRVRPLAGPMTGSASASRDPYAEDFRVSRGAATTFFSPAVDRCRRYLPLRRLRATANLLRRIKLMLPVQSCLPKYFGFRTPQSPLELWPSR